MKIHRHENSFVSASQLGGDTRPYYPTFEEDEVREFINFNHQKLAATQVDPDRPGLIDYKDVRGWLTVPDALKLYEMAYYSQADILELGCHHGLSTAIMAGAVRDASSANRIVTIDISAQNTARAVENLSRLELAEGVEVITSDATNLYRSMIDAGRRFSYMFVDHSHTYDDVLEACENLPLLLQNGGFCMFHDYSNRAGNTDGNDVYRAVTDGIGDQFVFHGVFGCSGLFRYTPKQKTTD